MKYPDIKLPDSLAGFEHIRRCWNNTHQVVIAKILPGEFYVTRGDEVIHTVLGSCVSACIRDSMTGIGGMNHFMLPVTSQERLDNGSPSIVGEATRYGNFAMEHLINTILQHGGKRRNLEVKVFGGGKIIPAVTDIGVKNTDFVLDYIYTEGFKVSGQDLGDVYPRKVLYFPSSGKVRVKKLANINGDTIVSRELRYREEIENSSIEGEIELF